MCGGHSGLGGKVVCRVIDCGRPAGLNCIFNVLWSESSMCGMYVGCSMWVADVIRRAWDMEGAGGDTDSALGVQCAMGCLKLPECAGLATALSEVVQCMLVVVITRLRWFPQQ